MKVAGFGFRQTVTLADLRQALTLAEAAAGPVQGLATARSKSASPALLALAAERGLPVEAVDVRGIPTRTQSLASRAAHGTGSVAEAAALGRFPGARLLAGRVVSTSGRATCAIALLLHENIPGESRRDGGSAPLPQESP